MAEKKFFNENGFSENPYLDKEIYLKLSEKVDRLLDQKVEIRRSLDCNSYTIGEITIERKITIIKSGWFIKTRKKVVRYFCCLGDDILLRFNIENKELFDKIGIAHTERLIAKYLDYLES